MIFRARTGIPWRDLPREQFGPWRTAWKRHRRYAADGTWDKVLVTLLADLPGHSSALRSAGLAAQIGDMP